MSMGLTPQTLKCRDYIAKFLRVKGVPPTIREIAVFFDLQSTSGVHRMVDELVDRGYLRRLPRQARGLELVEFNVCHHCGHRFGSLACKRAAARAKRLSSSEATRVPSTARMKSPDTAGVEFDSRVRATNTGPP